MTGDKFRFLCELVICLINNRKMAIAWPDGIKNKAAYKETDVSEQESASQGVINVILSW